MEYTQQDRKDLLKAGEFLRAWAARMRGDASNYAALSVDESTASNMALACGKALMLLDEVDE